MLLLLRNSPGLGAVLIAILLAAPAEADIAELTLRDQRGIEGGLSTAAPSLQLAIVVSAKRLRRIKPWERALREHDSGLPLIRVADVPRTAPTDFETVADRLRRRLPEEVTVLIDLDGVWTTTYELDSSVPNILIFDGGGQLLARHAGMFSAERFAAVEADLLRFAPLAVQTP